MKQNRIRITSHILISTLAFALAALPAMAADASKANTGAGNPARDEAAEREQMKQILKKQVDTNFPRAKEAEKKLDKAQKKLDEMNKFKQYVNGDALKQAQDELTAAQKEFDSATASLAINGDWLHFAPNDETQTVMDSYDELVKAFCGAWDRRKDYMLKREEEMKKAGKTEDEITTELIDRDPRIKEMDKEVDRTYEAKKKSESKFYKAYFEALKKAEQQGRYVIEDKTNDKFKASPTPNNNEPSGGLKLGGTSYAPPVGGTSLKTLPPTYWDFSGSGQVANPTMPPIIIMPGGSGWGGASPTYPSIPGFMPTVPGGATSPQSSACGCACKPTCTCKPVCNCKK